MKPITFLVLPIGIAAACITWGARQPAHNQRTLSDSLVVASTNKAFRTQGKTRIANGYAKLPLSFEVNRGQTDGKVKFLSRGGGYTLFLTADEAVLELTKSSAPASKVDAKRIPRAQDTESQASTVLRMKLLGANPKAEISGVEEVAGKSNYFVGNDPKKWRTNVANYAKVRYANVYGGVDVVYYGNQRQLEHDFIVAPDADPKAILLAFQGADTVRVSDRGDLLLQVPGGEVRLQKPVAYQEVSGVRQEIAARYQQKDNNRVGFDLAPYDTSKPLIIDPILVYSTYLGGGGLDSATSNIAVDTAGSAYIAGYTNSTNFPMTSGSYRMSNAGDYDVFVAKLAPAGNALVYSTYIGGSGEDVSNGRALALDSSGNVYVAGTTNSTDFPTTSGAFETSLQQPADDYFVAKLNAAGNALLYSTYLGNGAPPTSALGLAIDGSGSAYVFGITTSAGFPVTPAAFQTTYGGGTSDDFIAKLNPAGSALVYSTYLGGNGLEANGLGISVDYVGNAYVAATTESTNFPTTPGTFQSVLKGSQNVFVTKINPTGSALVYSTYLGGSNVDVGNNLTIDSMGNAYVIGYTQSADFPLTPGAFQTSLNGSTQMNFVTKLNAAGGGLVYSTFLGGSGIQYPVDVVLDTVGNAYLAGNTTSTDFPTAHAVQAANAGGEDAFVTELNATGSSLVFSTYLGGSGSDSAACLAVDGSGNIYLNGQTDSSNFPTVNPFQAVNGGGTDGFVAKIGEVERFAYVANSGSNSVSVINPASNTVVATVPVGRNPVHIGVTPDGTKAYVANAGANSVSVINTSTNKVSTTVAVGPHPVDVVVTPDGTKAFVTNGGANTVSVINIGTDAVTATVAVRQNPIDVFITGTKAYVINAGSNSVSIIDTSTNTVIATVPVGRNPFDMAVTPDGTKAYVANADSNSVSVINTNTNLVVATVPVGHNPADVAISPDGTKAYVTNAGSNSVSVINTSTNLVLATLTVGPFPLDIVLTPDGTEAYVTNAGANSVSVINTTTNTVATTIPVGSNPADIVVTRDGTKAYVTNAGSNSVSVINTSNNGVIATVAVGRNPIEVVLH